MPKYRNADERVSFRVAFMRDDVQAQTRLSLRNTR
jgi:hypothetical protein